mmetsp:Transcript_22372/g.38244  ORF Transcript_22372/g.38244 Transcript_22372/m.38244 type:complete len:186 (-) Transcript_22372:277-834(-)|eukprot:CAMPEP_0119114758 /NCGR_PEP_ID=MMETSP1180-20130426/48483_1 /TAXON_ID=3052 ORGANISM="Chlamydomonas cf sp, Strain CCMP681" /NCGR_SAMPLE_ID=MMETSP1180 /ASSEMBLY_ACC=CAM_ASM_000741 /LENGTH=185 /DNA_ID=CAMNT_0007103435 /DNA_START=162 /DNA_END=719 /DNA_ORIENTATION=-
MHVRGVGDCQAWSVELVPRPATQLDRLLLFEDDVFGSLSLGKSGLSGELRLNTVLVVATLKAPPTAETLDWEGTLLGYLLARKTSMNLHVSRMVVCEPWRRRGVGKALLQAALQAAASKQSSCSASLFVACTNLPAQALYSGAGFQMEGDAKGAQVHQDYYGVGQHAVRMVVEAVHALGQLKQGQ